jgi:hypothetical protein
VMHPNSLPAGTKGQGGSHPCSRAWPTSACRACRLEWRDVGLEDLPAMDGPAGLLGRRAKISRFLAAGADVGESELAELHGRRVWIS